MEVGDRFAISGTHVVVWYLAHSRAWRTGRVLNLTFCQSVERRVNGLAIAVVPLTRWLLADLTQVISEASFPSYIMPASAGMRGSLDAPGANPPYHYITRNVPKSENTLVQKNII